MTGLDRNRDVEKTLTRPTVNGNRGSRVMEEKDRRDSDVDDGVEDSMGRR